MFKDEWEYRYFQLFCGKTAFQLSGYFDSTLWSRRLVLQTCQSSSSIRHAVVAIAALGQILESTEDFHRLDKKGNADFHHQFALLQYSKAIRRMGDAAWKGKQDHNLGPAWSIELRRIQHGSGSHLAKPLTGLHACRDSECPARHRGFVITGVLADQDFTSTTD
jgi:hypothetical protein